VPDLIDSKLPRVGTTIFTRMSALAQECHALNLSQGFPDFDPPAALAAALGEHARGGHNQYAPMAGLPRLREAVAAQLRQHRGVDADADTEITIVPGATEGIFCAVTAVVRPGDEVIVLDPVYDSYEPAIELAGGRAVHVPLRGEDFSVDWDRVRDAIGPRTRMIMINSPHNPTGSTLKAQDLRTLAELSAAHDLIVCSDEVYEHLVFDGGRHHSVLELPELRERSFAHLSRRGSRTCRPPSPTRGIRGLALQVAGDRALGHGFDQRRFELPSRSRIRASLSSRRASSSRALATAKISAEELKLASLPSLSR
jgi:methionine aminotransferase